MACRFDFMYFIIFPRIKCKLHSGLISGQKDEFKKLMKIITI